MSSNSITTDKENILTPTIFDEKIECQYCYEIMMDDQLVKLWCQHYSCYDCFVKIRNSKEIYETSKICGICQKPLQLEAENDEVLKTNNNYQFLETPFRSPRDYDPLYNQNLSQFYQELILSLNGLDLENLLTIDNYTQETMEDHILKIDRNYPKIMVVDYRQDTQNLTIISLPSVNGHRRFEVNGIQKADPENNNFQKFYRKYLSLTILGFATFYNNIDTYYFLNTDDFKLEPVETSV